MRKLVLAALAAGIMSIVAVAIAAAHDDHSSGEWPTSCVDLNDIVEAHLGNDHNVGIYQRTFGDQAEAACQNDHRNDVRSVFAWAIGGEVTAPAPPPPVATPQPTPAPQQPSATSKLWTYDVKADPINQKDRHTATRRLTFEDDVPTVAVRCWLDRDEPLQIFVAWLTLDEGSIEGNYLGQVEVEYRFAGGDAQSE